VNSAKPVSQVLVQRLRAGRVFLRVVEAAAVHRPHLAGHALGLGLFVARRHQTRIEEDEVEG
jgi:hypothetical protein